MSKAAHTPTPWRIEDNDLHINIISDGHQRICHVYRWSDHKYDADAALIIKAVNHHQEIVTRLYNLVDQIENDPVLADGLRLALTEARETLKKVIQ